MKRVSKIIFIWGLFFGFLSSEGVSASAAETFVANIYRQYQDPNFSQSSPVRTVLAEELRKHLEPEDFIVAMGQHIGTVVSPFEVWVTLAPPMERGLLHSFKEEKEFQDPLVQRSIRALSVALASGRFGIEYVLCSKEVGQYIENRCLLDFQEEVRKIIASPSSPLSVEPSSLSNTPLKKLFENSGSIKILGNVSEDQQEAFAVEALLGILAEETFPDSRPTVLLRKIATILSGGIPNKTADERLVCTILTKALQEQYGAFIAALTKILKKSDVRNAAIFLVLWREVVSKPQGVKFLAFDNEKPSCIPWLNLYFFLQYFGYSFDPATIDEARAYKIMNAVDPLLAIMGFKNDGGIPNHLKSLLAMVYCAVTRTGPYR